MTVRAKVRCTSKALGLHRKSDGSSVESAQLSFCGVHKGGPDGLQGCEENKIFGEYTPGLNFTMYVVNPAAHMQIEQGGEYYLDLTPVPKEGA